MHIRILWCPGQGWVWWIFKKKIISSYVKSTLIIFIHAQIRPVSNNKLNILFFKNTKNILDKVKVPKYFMLYTSSMFDMKFLPRMQF